VAAAIALAAYVYASARYNCNGRLREHSLCWSLVQSSTGKTYKTVIIPDSQRVDVSINTTKVSSRPTKGKDARTNNGHYPMNFGICRPPIPTG
jgi:hypothetical protein